MQSRSKYAADDYADAGSAIKLKASEPLSPNAFVQIPVEEHQQQNAVYTPVARQKKMRVPRGGSVERPVQRSPKKPTRPVHYDEPPAAPMPPSLHIFLEPDPDEEPLRTEEEPDSLAQFVASFPRIPDGLIFQTDDGSADGEEDADAEGSDDRTGASDHEDRLIGKRDRAHGYQDEIGVGSAGPSYAQSSMRTRQAPSNERVMAAVNPRFEKMIREAASPRQRFMDAPASRTPSQDLDRMRTQAISGPLDQQSGAASRAFTGDRRSGISPNRPQGPTSFGRNSHPLPPRGDKQISYVSVGMAAGANAPWRADAQQASYMRSRTSSSGAHGSSHVAPPGMRRASGASTPRFSYAAQSSTTPLGSAAFRKAPSIAPSSIPSPTSAPQPQPASSLGEPLVDTSAIEESTIFDEPPISIAEGMKDADKSHKKGRKLIIVVLVFVIIALVGGFVFMSSRGGITIPEITITTTDHTGTSGVDASSSSASGSSGPTQESAGSDAPAASGAGSVIYRYTAKTPGGIEYSVEESTTFDAQGNCTFTTMRMQFPSEQAAKDFTDSLARDLGSKYTLDDLNGANATVTVDNSALGLDREDYENALRYSVDDLVILKK